MSTTVRNLTYLQKMAFQNIHKRPKQDNDVLQAIPVKIDNIG